MPYPIPQEKIAEIRDAIDIVDLISGYLTLKKSGKNYMGLCPFHQEKTPSFSVDPVRQMYHCFGCHKGGNAISFIMDYEKLSFLEAVKFLAEKAGISLPQKQVSDNQFKEKEALFFANKLAAEFYYKNLTSPAGRIAREYLGKRGFNDSIIRSFGLGYSLPEWDGLIKFARNKSASLEILYKAGLIIKKENGGYYDRFRGRLMIPIINLSKKVVGFGGRILVKSDKAPKYINSPETAVYQKSHLLYGLFKTREKIREKDFAIFVEGYTDVLSLYMYGAENVVATSGTALTTGQAQLIQRYTENIFLIYDSDAAGSAASMRGADIFLNAGLNVKIVALPQGHDPDSFIKEQGVESFNRLLSNALSVTQFKIKNLSQQPNLDRAKIIEMTLESVSKIKNSVKQDLARKEVAEYFGIEEQSLIHQLKSIKTMTYDDQRQQADKPAAPKKIKTKHDVAEEDLVKLLIFNSEFVKYVFHHLELSEIQNETIRHFTGIIYHFYQENAAINESTIAGAVTDPTLSARLSGLLADDFSGENIDHQKLLNDCIIMIKKRSLEAAIQEVSFAIKNADHDMEKVKELSAHYQYLRKEIQQLKTKNFIITEKNT